MRVHTGATPDTAAAGAARTASGGPPPENSPPLEQQLGRWARDRPHEVALSVASRAAWTSITWLELDEATRRAAADPGAGPTLVVLDNSIESVVALLGRWRAGGDTVLVEANSSHLTDRHSVLWRGDVATVLAPPEHPALDALAAAGHRLVIYGAQPAHPTRVSTTDGEPLVHQLTSGATGEPRLATHPLSNLLRGGAIYRHCHGLTPADRIVAPIPLAHSFGVVGGLLASIDSGATLLTMPRLMLRRLGEGLSQPSTVLLGTPLLLRMASTAAAGAAPAARTVRVVLSSGGPLPDATAAAVREWLGIDVYQIYGSTETGLISCQFDRTQPWPAGSVGRPAPGVTVRLGTGDELSVTTSTMFTGCEGWYDTGDLARLDDDGHLFVTGRKASFVNVGGRKVSVARTERILRECGLVRDVAVYGVERGDGEEEIHAAVELAAGAVVADVQESCRRSLAPYEVPHVFHVVAQLPRSALGKVERARLPTGA